MRKPTRRMSTDARRAQLLALGRKVFSERAYDEISTDELARLAGISKGLLYHYFKNKRGFYVAVMRDTADRLYAVTAPTTEGDVREAFEKSMMSYLEFIERNAPMFKALIRGGIGFDTEVNEIVEGVRRDSVRQCTERMGIEDPSATVRAKLYGWVGFCEFLSIDWLDRKDLPKETVHHMLVQSLLELMEWEVPEVINAEA